MKEMCRVGIKRSHVDLKHSRVDLKHSHVDLKHKTIPKCRHHKRTPAVLRTPDYAASGRAAELIPDLSYICRNLNFYFIHNSQIYLNFSHADFKMQSAKDLKAVSYRLKKQSAKDLKSSQQKT